MAALYLTLPHFLGEDLSTQLYDHACSNEARFKVAMVTSNGKDDFLDRDYRISSKLRDLGVLAAVLEARILPLVPTFIKELGLESFQPSGLELELVAHGDGGFYKWHIDTFTGSGRSSAGEDRLITLVYYLHSKPKRFSGGNLRLYPLPRVAGTAASPVEISPDQDLAVVFPSWLPHEVLKVACPSAQFPDFRFSLNCWVLRTRPG